MAATVTIAAGATSARFDITVIDDADLDCLQRATITASAAGYTPGSDTIAVSDDETAVLTVTVPGSALESGGVLAEAGTVTLDRVPTSDVLIELSSADTTEVTVPSTVTILAGQTSAKFDVTIVDDAEIDGIQTAMVGAHAPFANIPNASPAAIAVSDNDAYLAVQLPAAAWENAGTLVGLGTVTIGGTLTYDLTVSLRSDDTSELEDPAAVTILAGQTSATFALKVVDDPDQDGVQTVTVTASAPGLAGGGKSMLVRDDELHHFSFDAIASPQLADEAFGVRVAAVDVNGETILVYGGNVLLSGASGAASVAVDPTGLALIDGVWTGQVRVQAVAGSVVLRVDDGVGGAGQSNAFDVTHGVLDHFEWHTIDSPQYANLPFSATLAAVDAHGYTVADYNDTVELSGLKDGSALRPWKYCRS